MKAFKPRKFFVHGPFARFDVKISAKARGRYRVLLQGIHFPQEIMAGVKISVEFTGPEFNSVLLSAFELLALTTGFDSNALNEKYFKPIMVEHDVWLENLENV